MYLYSSKHNGQLRGKAGCQVVNCFKMCIFAVASTINEKSYKADNQL